MRKRLLFVNIGLLSFRVVVGQDQLFRVLSWLFYLLFLMNCHFGGCTPMTVFIRRPYIWQSAVEPINLLIHLAID